VPVDLQPVEPAALICAILADSERSMDAARARLAELFGEPSQLSESYPFTHSTYYRREMGANLTKQIAAFAQRVDPADLPRIKRATMALEHTLADQGAGELRRRANIDPGLVTVESLVLATTKYSGHRICIGPALYAEVTLLFQRGGCRPFEWTYPDFRDSGVHQFLQSIRDELLGERRQRLAAGTAG
jgi:hypothetical protein